MSITEKHNRFKKSIICQGLVTIGSPGIPIFTVKWGSPSPFYCENGDPRGSLFRERVPVFLVERGPRSPFCPENQDPHPHIPGKMGMEVPDFGGPHFPMTPASLVLFAHLTFKETLNFLRLARNKYAHLSSLKDAV